MDWNTLRFVIALAEQRRLALAASSLGVARTTVGRRIRELEEDLGVRLFERTRDGYAPTAAGLELVAVGRRVQHELQQAEQRLRGQDALLSGPLCVSTLDLLFGSLKSAFASFVERFPEVELTVTTPSAQVSVTRGDADVVLRLSAAPGDHLVGRRIGKVAFAVYGSSGLVKRVGHAAPLSAFPWIGWDEASSATHLERWFEAHAPGARVAMRIEENFLVLRRAVESGAGVHFLPCFDADPDEGLVRLSPVLPEMARDLWLLTSPDLRTNRRVRCFMDHMEAAVRPLSAAMRGV
ncbi:MAG: LysR family transcriptional regulator [Sandaracinaceae bacterium]